VAACGVGLPRLEVIARVLAKAEQKPGLSPSRLCSYSSVEYYSFKAIVEAGFLRVEEVSRDRRVVRLTAKGRRFLEAYRKLQQL
jgi:predicted transcriptional regulator